MRFFCGKRAVLVLLTVAAVMMLPLAASADIIAVTAADFTGSRSTANSSSGLVTADGWTAANGGFKISWLITQTGTTFNYSYTFANADGTTPTTPDLSHLILEVSQNFTVNDISNAKLDGVAVTVVGPQTFTKDPSTPNNTSPGGNNGNPNLPADIFGIKLDNGGTTYTFSSLKSPVWGDFYVKDGLHDGIVATAWNAGFGTDPSLGGPFTNWVPTPDTTQVPIPPSALLLGSGLLGLGLIGWRRREKKA